MRNAFTTIGTACLALGSGTLGVVQPGTVSDFAAIGSMVVAVTVLSRELVRSNKRHEGQIAEKEKTIAAKDADIERLHMDMRKMAEKCLSCKHLDKCKSCEFVQRSNKEFIERR